MSDELQAEHHKALDLLIRGFQISRTLRLAADLEIADRVPADNGRSVEDLASSCEVQVVPLLRVLRALSAFGIFRISNGLVLHTPRSLLLRTDSANSLHAAARFWTAQGAWNAWGALDAALKAQVPHHKAWGTGRFEYLRDHPGEARVFDAFMASFPDHRHEVIAQSYDFSDVNLIADIGGGSGETLRRVLSRFPNSHGLLFDRPDVVSSVAPEALQGGRIRVEGGNFFERVPPEADLYLLIRVLHNWSDADCVRILQSCRRAMRPDARLLVVDQLLETDPSRGQPTDYLVDLQMMAMFGDARERTRAEFEGLVGACGLCLVRVIPTMSAVAIIEIAPA